MQTCLTSKLTPEFNFAGFAWPRYVARLPQGSFKQRIERAKNRCTGEYYHAPKPTQAGKGCGFYLESDGQPFTRWAWADDVVSLHHTGWFCDEDESQTMRGIVARLPHGRFLAGWSMGEGMASEVDGYIYNDEEDAARAADSMAENAAERERDYQQQENRRFEAEQQRIDNRFADAIACGI
jgi:hypothetical protein